jgi:hypothetical protein
MDIRGIYDLPGGLSRLGGGLIALVRANQFFSFEAALDTSRKYLLTLDMSKRAVCWDVSYGFFACLAV